MEHFYTDQMYWKPTHTDLYIYSVYATYHHYPAQKQTTINILAGGKKGVSDHNQYLQEECQILHSNAYYKHSINIGFSKIENNNGRQHDDTSINEAFLCYVKGIIDGISKIIHSYKIQTICRLHRKTVEFIRPYKNSILFIIEGVYKVTCNCSKIYIDQSSWFIYMSNTH